MQILSLWNHNCITLNEARAGFGLPHDPVFGHLFRFMAFRKPETKADVFHDYEAAINRITDQAAEKLAARLLELFADLSLWEEKSLSPDERRRMKANAASRLSKLKRKLTETLKQELREPSRQAAEEAKILLSQMGADPKFDEGAWEKEFDRASEDIAEAILKRHREQVRSLIDQAAEEGWSREELQQKLDEYVAGLRERTRRMAETEAHRMNNLAARRVFADSGIQAKQWQAESQKPCPFCEHLHGTILPIDQPFLREGEVLSVDVSGKTKQMTNRFLDVLTPPLHPNCRCLVVPVMRRGGGRGFRPTSPKPDGGLKPNPPLEPVKTEPMERPDLNENRAIWETEIAVADDNHIQSARLEVLDRIENDPDKADAVKRLIQRMQEQGHLKSGDDPLDVVLDAFGDPNSPLHVAVQLAARKEFGLTHARMDHLIARFSEAEPYADVMDGLQAILRTQYEVTQEWIQYQDLPDEVVLYRGISSQTPLPDALHDRKPTFLDHPLQPISSFTVNPRIAKKWADSGEEYKAVIAARVPSERILAFPGSGAGKRDLREVLVLGPNQTPGERFWAVTWKGDWDHPDVNLFLPHMNPPIPGAPIRKATTELGKKVEERRKQGIHGFQDLIDLGDIVLKEKNQRMKERMIEEVTEEGTQRISMAEMQERLMKAYRDSKNEKLPKEQQEAAASYLTQNGDRFIREIRELNRQLLEEIRPLGQPKGKRIDWEWDPKYQKLFDPPDVDAVRDAEEDIHRFFPTDWWKKTKNQPIFLGTDTRGGGLYQPKDAARAEWGIHRPVLTIHPAIMKDPSALKHILAHELTHHFQESVPALKDFEVEYLMYRAKGRSPERLNDIAKRRGFRPIYGNMIGFDGDFKHVYQGVFYRHPDGGSGEIVTSGVEHLFPSYFTYWAEQRLAEDPEYEKFLWGLFLHF